MFATHFAVTVSTTATLQGISSGVQRFLNSCNFFFSVMFNDNVSAMNLMKGHGVIHRLVHASCEDVDTGNIILCQSHIASSRYCRTSTCIF